MFIHPLSDVASANIGQGTNVWQFCVILKGAVIGDDCNICAHVFIENDVRIGNNVTIKSGVQIWDGIVIGDNVFIGPNVTLTNDLVPRSKHRVALSRTILETGCSIGANATVITGVTIGEYSLIGAGSVVTKDIPPHTVWYGNPAEQKGYITRTGTIINEDYFDKNGIKHSLDE